MSLHENVEESMEAFVEATTMEYFAKASVEASGCFCRGSFHIFHESFHGIFHGSFHETSIVSVKASMKASMEASANRSRGSFHGFRGGFHGSYESCHGSGGSFHGSFHELPRKKQVPGSAGDRGNIAHVATDVAQPCNSNYLVTKGRSYGRRFATCCTVCSGNPHCPVPVG